MRPSRNQSRNVSRKAAKAAKIGD